MEPVEIKCSHACFHNSSLCALNFRSSSRLVICPPHQSNFSSIRAANRGTGLRCLKMSRFIFHLFLGKSSFFRGRTSAGLAELNELWDGLSFPRTSCLDGGDRCILPLSIGETY